MTLVSKNGLSFIDLFAIEFEIRREGPLHFTELLECPRSGPVTAHLEVAFTCDGNLDFVSLFEIESLDNHSGKTHSQTVAPFGNLHKRYTWSIVYPYELGINRRAMAGNAPETSTRSGYPYRTSFRDPGSATAISSASNHRRPASPSPARL